MLDNTKLALDLLSKFNLKDDDVTGLTIAGAFTYIRFHSYFKKRKYKFSILFLGFSESETSQLEVIAKSHELYIQKKLSSRLTFLCTSQNTETEFRIKVKEEGTFILNRIEFDFLFPKTHHGYNLQSNKFLFDFNIPYEFRVAKPSTTSIPISLYIAQALMM